jgi:hypothetical protein
VTDSGKRVYRKFDAPRDRPARPFSPDRPRPDRPRPDRASSDRPARPYNSDRPARTFSDRPARPGGFSSQEGDRPARKPFGKPFAKPAGGGFAGKRQSGKPGGFGGKKPFSKPGGSFAGKPNSTFAKFADGNKPFGKRPPARKFKPKEDGTA